MGDLSRLLQPKSIAVLGGVWADTVVDQCKALGFEGAIYRVHPKRGEYASLHDLPQTPDAVFLGVNRDLTIPIVQEARELGCGGVVCFASGFAEMHNDTGDALNAALLDAAGDMPILGPNCYGMANFFDRVGLLPDQLEKACPETGVFVATQSGTVGLNIMYSDRSLPLGYLITIGNQAQVKIHDLIEAALNDDRVKAIGTYLEAIPDPHAFTQAVERARAKGVPVVVLKSGASDVAQATTLSHTGALAGEDRIFDAYFDRIGVVRVQTLPELVETLKLFHAVGSLDGTRLAALAPSGGDIAVAADIFSASGLGYAPMTPDVKTMLRGHMDANVSVENPFDFQTQNWHDGAHLETMFDAFFKLDADLFCLHLDHPDPQKYDASSFDIPLHSFIRSALRSGKKALSVSAFPEALHPHSRNALNAAGIAAMQGAEDCARAILHVADWSQWQGEAPPALAWKSRATAGRSLSEAKAKTILGDLGFPVLPARAVAIDKAGETAAELGFPVVVKASSDTIAHKTDLGGVALNLGTRKEAQAAANHMGTFCDQVLVEKFLTGVVAELILGIKSDPIFGPVIVLGAGGVLAELLDDSTVLLPPLNAPQIEAALDGLKVTKLIDGFRGQAAGDKAALIALIDALGKLTHTHPNIQELDLNPVAVMPKGQGVWLLDAFLKIETED